MTIRSWTRGLEKRLLRPLGRLLPRGRGQARGRLGQLERRVEELESLVRELTGLVALSLEERPTADEESAATAGPGAREAA